MAEPNTDPTVDNYKRSMDHLRDTAKWIFGTFSGLGGVLIAGSQVSSIGHLNFGDTRLVIAVIALAAGLVAVGVVIKQAVAVLTTGEVDLDRLERKDKEFVKSTGVLADYQSVEALSSDVNQATEKLREAMRINDTSKIPDLTSVFDRQDKIVQRVLAAARYNKVKRTFFLALILMYVFGGTTAVAISVFAWAANPPS